MVPRLMGPLPSPPLSSPAQARLSERREEKIREMKSKYEHQLADMKRELKQLQLAKKEHSKAMKKNVSKEISNTVHSVHMQTIHNHVHT